MKGSITKRDDGVYLLRLSIGYRTLKCGRRKRKYKTETIHGTRKEAEKRLRVLVSQYETGGVVDHDKTPLQDFLREWLELSKGGIALNTRRSYEHHIEAQIGPAIGDLPLSRITAMDVQRFYAKLAKDYSSSTVRICHTILRQGMRQAARWRRISYNPMGDVDRPAGKRLDKPQRHFGREHLTTFLERLKGERDGLLYRLAFYGGARPGENLALTWPCVDWVAGGILIRAKVLRESGKPLRLDVTKTESSERFIPLPDFIMAELRAHRVKVIEARMAHADKWDPTHDLVFPNLRTGKLRCGIHANARVKELYKKFGLPVLDLYALRHSFATAHLLGRESSKVVAALMGHSSTTVTNNIYTHYQDEMGRAAADNLGRLFPG